MVVGKAWHFLPENTESWGDFLEYATIGIHHVFQNRAKLFRKGDRVVVSKSGSFYTQEEGVVLSVQESLAEGSKSFEIAYNDKADIDTVSASELALASPCLFSWSKKTIIAGGDKGFQNARNIHARNSYLFLCTNHRRDRAIKLLGKAKSRMYSRWVHNYAYASDKSRKIANIKGHVSTWADNESAWVHKFDFHQQMPWCSRMTLINGALKTV